MSGMTGKKLTSLQVGRGLAALGVATYHISDIMGRSANGGVATFNSLTWRGSLGVDFFFVLSGFIILQAHERDISKPGRLGNYLWRRFARVYPIYWLYTLVAIILILAMRTSAPMPSSIFGVFQSATLIRLVNEPSPILAAWTLYHEMAFYAFFAVLIINRRVGLICLGAWFAICAATYHYNQPPWGTGWVLYSSSYNLNFMAGMLTFKVFQKGRFPRSIFVFGLIIFVAALVCEAKGFGVSPLVYTLAFSAMLAGAAMIEVASNLKLPAALILLGDASYSLYLLNWQLSSVASRVLIRSLHLDVAVGRPVIFALILVATVSGGVLAYWFIERPILAAARKLGPKGRAAKENAA